MRCMPSPSSLKGELNEQNLNQLQWDLLLDSNSKDNCHVHQFSDAYMKFCDCPDLQSFRIKHLFEEEDQLVVYNKIPNDPFHKPLNDDNPEMFEEGEVKNLCEINDSIQETEKYVFVPVSEGLFKRIPKATPKPEPKPKESADSRSFSAQNGNEDYEIDGTTTVPHVSRILKAHDKSLNIRHKDLNGVTIEFESEDSDLLFIKKDHVCESDNTMKHLKASSIEGGRKRSFVQLRDETGLRFLKFPNLTNLNKRVRI